MKRRWLPLNVSEYTDRHGKTRYRWRKAGHKTYHFKGEPGTHEFLTELEACRAAGREKAETRVIPGSFDDLAERFYRSMAWANMKPITRSTYRGIIDRFCKQHGTKPVALIKPTHLDAIIAEVAADRPGAATNLRKTLKRLLNYGIKVGMVSANAAAFTDPVRMGRQHVRNGRIQVRQEKTGKLLWIKIAPQLQAAIAAMPPSDAMLFLVTEFGKGFTAAGFGNWFRDQCRAAGLDGCTAHGLRKAMARRAADLKATNQQIKAVGGWTGDSEVALYTAAADQVGLADSVIDAVAVWDVG